MAQKTVLVFAGSARKDSVNKKFAAIAANHVDAAGAAATLIDLADFDAPLYHGDLEAESGLPEKMAKLRSLMAQHDAILIVTPEYNGSVPPLLVNCFAWASRTEGDEKISPAFAGKPVAIAAASPGGLGGVRVLPRLRDMLAELGAVVIPGFATLPGAFQAFDETGALTNAQADGTLKDLATRLVAF